MTERRRVSSGGPWEARYGYGRAIVASDACHVAGTTDAGLIDPSLLVEIEADARRT